MTSTTPHFLSGAEVRALLYVSRSTLSRYCQEGRLEAVKTPGGSWRVLADQPALRELLERAGGRS